MTSKRIPRQFRAGPHMIKVRIISRERMRLCDIAANGKGDKEPPLGLWVDGENAILLQRVRIGFNADAQWLAFWHEYFHALFDRVGESKLSANEGLVERCAVMHMQMLGSMK